MNYNFCSIFASATQERGFKKHNYELIKAHHFGIERLMYLFSEAHSNELDALGAVLRRLNIVISSLNTNQCVMKTNKKKNPTFLHFALL